MRLAVALLAVALSAALAPAQNSHVVATDPLSPADERKALAAPPGFEVQLVAAEPDIQKPIQMAFDAKGRLWVTTSYLYPFPAPPGKGTDKLFVLSDFGPDGKARKVETFADTLNIPIGVLPLPDCKSCIVGSVGQILKLTDTNGDGKADKTEVLFDGFGFKDTHGMMNSFTLMPDGWVYATHGFSNESVVKGKDGHEVRMHSGNTFRFRPDGSRIEVFTRGQVNPFGIAVDPWFNLYTADCHSKPITQLIRGATYTSFAKPHDGLGFAPHVARHDHGSTALCGLTWYDADHFPPEYRGRMFLGNVVTGRVNADVIRWHGSTPEAVEQPDFVTSSDRWFRPTDIRQGPDGAVYVADFYNRIIGHYEVDLKHPGRDKDRGRVWRVVWKGLDGKAKPPAMPFADLTTMTAEDVDRLIRPNSQNLTVRLLVVNELIRRAEQKESIEPAKVVESDRSSVGGPFTDAYRVDRKWIAFRAGTLNWEKFGLTTRPGREVPLELTHRARLAAAKATLTTSERQAMHALAEMPQAVPVAARAAVDALTAHPHADNVKPLVELLKAVPAEDTHLKYAARVALRNSLTADSWSQQVAGLPADALPVVADVAVAVPTEDAATFLSGRFIWDKQPLPDALLVVAAEHVGRYGTAAVRESVAGTLVGLNHGPAAGDAFAGLVRGLQARGEKVSPAIRKRVMELADQELTRPAADAARLSSTLKMLPAVTADDIRAMTVAFDPDGTLARTRAGLARLAARPSASDELRLAAVDALLRVDPANGATALRPVLADRGTSAELRDKLLVAFAGSPSKDARLDARDGMKTAPYRTAAAIATALAGTRGGAETLLTAVKDGVAPTRLLQEKTVLQRLKASGLPDADARVAALTKGLPPAEQRVNDLIKKRTAAFPSAKADAKLGQVLFAKNCAACHQIGGQGGKVGPNLDGIGVRGPERLLEDVLDPNRNVDAAFRARTLALADGRTMSGLMLRVEGKVVVMADAEGKEVRVPEGDIETNTVTNLSPMPANFDATVPEAEFPHLLAYLLEQRPK